MSSPEITKKRRRDKKTDYKLCRQNTQPAVKQLKRHAAQYCKQAKIRRLTAGSPAALAPLPGEGLPVLVADQGREQGAVAAAAAAAAQQHATVRERVTEGTSETKQHAEGLPTPRSEDQKPPEGGGGTKSHLDKLLQTAAGELRPSELSSPLSKRIVTWYEELAKVHEHTCTNKSKNCCAGVRPLTILCKEDKSTRLGACAQYQCLQAVEAELLLHSLYYGFPVLPEGTVPKDYPKAKTPNYPCPERQRKALSTAVEEEIRLGILKVVGDEPHQLTALTYKDEKGGKVRPIRDYSAPHDGTSVNAHWPSRHFKMMGLHDAYPLMTPHCYMAKVDIKSAFRTVSVRPDQQDVLSINWDQNDPHRSRYIRDTRLPFGWAGSPEAFCRLTAAVRAMMVASGHKSILVYVDDFLIIGASFEECKTSLDCLLQLLHTLGFTVAEEKTAGPAQDMAFLGLRLQSNADGAGQMTVEVPKDKLEEVVETVQLLLSRNRKPRSLNPPRSMGKRGKRADPHTPESSWATRRELQSLLGKLNHIGQAVYSSRAYMRGMIDVLKALNSQRRKGTSSKGKGGAGGGSNFEPRDPADADTSSIPLSTNLMRDLYWWANFASHFNGKTQLLEVPEMMPGYFATDAADWGMGGVLNPSLQWAVADPSGLTWFSIPWAAGYGSAVARLPKHVRGYLHKDMFPTPDVPNRWWIAYREQFALFYSLLLWADSFRGRHVVPYVDNTVAVATFNKLSATNWVMQRLVQAQASLMADFNIRGTAIWIESAENVLGDPLSRGDLPAFREALQSWHPPQAPIWGRATFSNPPLMEQAAREHMGLPAKRAAPSAKSAVQWHNRVASLQEEQAFLEEEGLARAEHQNLEDSLLRSEWLLARGH